ncbi:MAG: hypothetical protein INQ03_08550 [Candidatus Heimdallarchaeota archaeon]|nr:hypothetical protein [Candidatus Heimdallarchaeota archaeon]
MRKQYYHREIGTFEVITMWIRRRRAQIRGIDFSLSMIIFLLTMIQILILTSNFIASNNSYQSSVEREAIANSIAQDIVYSTGVDASGNDWLSLGTSQIQAISNWNFGLSTDGTVDPYKLSRLSNWSLDSLHMDYDTIKSGLNLGTKEFRIKLQSAIDVEITSVDTTDLTQVLVNGLVKQDGNPLKDAYVHVVISEATDTQPIPGIGYNYTSSSGNFAISIDMNSIDTNTDPTQYTIIVFANYGGGSQAIDVYNIISSTAGNMNLIQTSAISLGYATDVHVARTGASDQLRLHAFYVGKAGTNNASDATQADATLNPSNWTIQDFNIPQSGYTVFVSYDYTGGSLNSMALLTFPVILDDSLSSIIQPVDVPNSVSAVVTIPIIVRGVMMNFELTVWGE